MREYSAISVSAADATSLADRLTEQAQRGWSLVEIVNTNDQVVAYLERDGQGTTAPGDSGVGGTASGAIDGDATSSIGSTGLGSTGVGSTGLGSTGLGSTGYEPSSYGSTPPGATATETITAFQDDAGNAAIVDQTTYSMDVPAGTASTDANSGWGAASGAAAGLAAGAAQSASDTAADANNRASDAADSATDAASAAVASAAGGVAGSASDVAGTAADASGHAASAGATGSTDNPTPASGVQSGSGASGGMAPAGWYADPAGRFELRYWDGTQWTEHVASGSEQDTDPPVKNAD